MLVDDAHWLDGSSAEALLLRRCGGCVADPIAVVLAVREGEPSLLDGADLPDARGSTGSTGRRGRAAARRGSSAEAAERLYRATGGNPLALLELGAEPRPARRWCPATRPCRSRRASSPRSRGAPTLLGETTRRMLVLAAASDAGDLGAVGRAAAQLGSSVDDLDAAEEAGLVRLDGGAARVPPPARPLGRLRAASDPSSAAPRTRRLPAALPDRDVDRRAWHLAAAALGRIDEASAALEQAARERAARSAYAVAAAAFERAARLAPATSAAARLLFAAAEAAWLGRRCRTGRCALLDEAARTRSRSGRCGAHRLPARRDRDARAGR